MCGGGVGNALNQIQNFAPLKQPIQDAFGTNQATDALAGAVIGPTMSGQLNQSGDITPGSYLGNRSQNIGIDQMLPAAQMFGKAIAGGFAGSAAAGADGVGFGTDPEAAGTSAANAPAAGTDTLVSGGGGGGGGGDGGQPGMPPAQPIDPATLNAMGLQQVPDATGVSGQTMFTQTGTPNATPGSFGTPPTVPQNIPQQPGASGQSPAQDPNAQQQPGQQQPGAQGQQQPGQQPGTQQQQPGMVDKILKSMKDNPLGTASVGLLAANTLAARPKQNQAIQQQQGISAQAQQQAQQLLAQYQSGTLSAGQQSQLDALTNNTKNQLRQYFASIGQSDSTAAVQSLAQVDQQAQGMKQQMLDNALSQGLSALGIASGPLTSVANYQLGQDKQLRDAFGNFATQVGTIFGRQSGQTPQTGTQTPSNQTTTQPAQTVSSTDPNNPSPP